MDPSIFDKSRFPWINKNFSLFSKNRVYPKVSVIVPSYNQGFYLEETLLSIINQNYPNLELIVIDGGSKDNSVEIIKKYETYVSYWVSEKDKGQSDAINKGIKKATGEWIGWMNSDDCYLQDAFYHIFHINNVENYDFLYGITYDGLSINSPYREIENPGNVVSNKMKLYNLLQFFFATEYIIASQSVFIRNTLIQKAGLLDEKYHFCMDLEWYARFSILNPRVLFYNKTLSFFRINNSTKTGTTVNKIPEEAMEIAEKYSGHLKEDEKVDLLKKIKYYRKIRKYLLATNKKLSDLILILLQFPILALSDNRFKTMLKEKLV